MSFSKSLTEFHQTYGVPVRTTPGYPSEERVSLRRILMQEELDEVLDAIELGNIEEVAKELADLIYVVVGTALEFGLPIDEVFEAVHNSNMSKLDDNGKPIYREADGKVLKGPNYYEPNIKKVLGI